MFWRKSEISFLDCDRILITLRIEVVRFGNRGVREMRRMSGVSILTKFMLEHFGKRFKEWLNERGVTLMDMARDLKLSYTNLYSFGAAPPLGRLPGPENAIMIAEYLRVPREEFFSAMGQIDPLLLEGLKPEEVEAAFLQLHQWLKERKKEGRVVDPEEARKRKMRLIEMASADLDEKDIELLAKIAEMLGKRKREWLEEIKGIKKLFGQGDVMME